MSDVTAMDPAEFFQSWQAARLMNKDLKRRIIPRQVATSKRGPKIEKPKAWVAGTKARAHVSTARVLKAAMEQKP